MSHKEQLRLVMLCVSLVLVIVAMQKVAQPESWGWLIPPEKPVTEETSNGDQVIISLNKQAGTKSEQPVEWQPLLSDAEKQRIEDDYLGLRESEEPLVRRIAIQLAQFPRGLLQLKADQSGAYQVWMAETDAWRGRVIEFEARAKRIRPRQNSDEEPQSERLYDLWVTTEGSGSMPLHVVTAGLPTGVTAGDDVDIPVHLIGTLFKREGYAAEGGLRTTLLMVAAPPHQVQTETASATEPPGRLMPLMMMMAIALSLFIVFSLWRTFRSAFTTPSVSNLRSTEEPETEPDFSELEAADTSEDVRFDSLHQDETEKSE